MVVLEALNRHPNLLMKVILTNEKGLYLGRSLLSVEIMFSDIL